MTGRSCTGCCWRTADGFSDDPMEMQKGSAPMGALPFSISPAFRRHGLLSREKNYGLGKTDNIIDDLPSILALLEAAAGQDGCPAALRTPPDPAY